MGDLSDLAKDLFASGRDMDHALQMATVKGAEILRHGIVKNVGTHRFTPLAASTVARKGGDLQLLEQGKLRQSISTTIGHHEAWIGSTDPKSIYLELGTSRMPARPFIRTALDQNAARIERLAAAAVLKAMRGHGPHAHMIDAVFEAGRKIKEIVNDALETDDDPEHRR